MESRDAYCRVIQFDFFPFACSRDTVFNNKNRKNPRKVCAEL